MGSADSAEGFTRWYSRTLRTVVHIDASDDSFCPYHRAAKDVFSLSNSHVSSPTRSEWVDRPNRPASSVYSDRLKRSIAVREVSTSKSAKAGASSKAKSPRAKLSLSQPSTGPLGSSQCNVARSSPQESRLVLTQTTRSQFDLPPLSGGGSVSPFRDRRRLPSNGVKQGFGSKLREALWLLDEEFSHTSTLLRGIYKTNLNKERIVAITIDALTQRCKSPASTRGVIRNVNGLIDFFLENRNDGNPPGFTLTGENSAVLLRDYIESAAGRGLEVPGAVKTSISARPEALGINLPLDNPIFCSAAHVDSNEAPKHAPQMKLDNVKKLEELTLNVEVAPFKRAFAEGVLLVTFTSLRFSDVQRLRSLEMNDDSVYGTLPQSKTRRPMVAVGAPSRRSDRA